MARSSQIGHSIFISSILALLSYVPFEYIAKSTLLFCAITFINDPFPPISRVISLGGVILVLILSKIERTWREGQEQEQQSEGTRTAENTASSKESAASSKNSLKKD